MLPTICLADEFVYVSVFDVAHEPSEKLELRHFMTPASTQLCLCTLDSLIQQF